MVTSLSLETRPSRQPPISHPFIRFFDKFESLGKESDWQSGLFHRASIDNWHPLVSEGANLSRKKRRTKLLRIASSNFISAPPCDHCATYIWQIGKRRIFKCFEVWVALYRRVRCVQMSRLSEGKLQWGVCLLRAWAQAFPGPSTPINLPQARCFPVLITDHCLPSP